MIGTFLSILGSIIAMFTFIYKKNLTKKKTFVVLIVAVVFSLAINRIDLTINNKSTVTTNKSVYVNSVVSDKNFEVVELGVEPQEGDTRTRYVFYVNSDIKDNLKYEIYIQFANSDGTDEKEYSSGYYSSVDKLEYIQNKWSISKNFKQPGKFIFRVFIKDLTGKEVWISEERELLVRKDDSQDPYANSVDNVKVGNLFEDKVTGITISVSSIGMYYSDVNLIFPDGTKEDGYFKSGESWEYQFNNRKFRVIFYNPDVKNQTFSIKVEELMN